MKHIYNIEGMTCQGCRQHVEEALSNVTGVTKVNVDLDKGEATIEMEQHILIEAFQHSLDSLNGNYTISPLGKKSKKHHKKFESLNGNGTGVFYCPMHCEGEKTYDKPGDCPVCGMDLVEEQNLASTKTDQWTCPMHPEVIKDESGS